MHEELLKAIKIVGSRQKLAILLGTSRAVINHWLNSGVNIPLQYGLLIEIITEGNILAEKLVPHCKEAVQKFKNYCKR